MMSPTRAWLCSTLILTLALLAVRTYPLVLRLPTHTATSVTTEDVLRLPMTANDRITWSQITRNDQSLSIWQGTQNARALIDADPGRLLAQRQCYPMPMSGTLGEHEIEFGILSVPWLVLSGDPVVSYNLALATMLLVAAAGMFLYVHRWTSSVHASAAAAIAFALSPVRFPDALVHPAVEGFHWIPIVLWAFDAAVDAGRPRHFVILAFALVMGGLVGGYPLTTLAALAGPYAAVRMISQWRLGAAGTARTAWLAVASLPAIAIVASILASYGATASTWVVEGTRAVVLAARSDFLPGGPLFPGIVAATGLLLLGRRRSRGSASPAMALMVAGIAVFLLCSEGPLWPGGPRLPALYSILAERFSMLLAVRAPQRVAAGATIAFLALGLIGWGRMLSGAAPATRTVAGLLLVFVVSLEFLIPALARWSYGPLLAVELTRVAPQRDVVAALESLGDSPGEQRAVLDVPTGRMLYSGSALILASYHARPTSACYQSLTPVSEWEADVLADRIRFAGGIEELALAGFGHLIIHRSEPSGLRSYTGNPPPAPARQIFGNDSIEIYELPPAPPSHHETSALQIASVTEGPQLSRSSLRRGLMLRFENTAAQGWALPRPAEPVAVQVTFAPKTGEPFVTHGRLLPPLALGPGATRDVMLAIHSGPVAGEYAVTVALHGWAQAVTNPSLRWSGEAVPPSPGKR